MLLEVLSYRSKNPPPCEQSGGFERDLSQTGYLCYSEAIMATITIPKHPAGQRLVLVPEEEYEEYKAFKQTGQPPRVFKTARMTKAQKRAFERAERNYEKGNFVTLDVLRRDLASRR